MPWNVRRRPQKMLPEPKSLNRLVAVSSGQSTNHIRTTHSFNRIYANQRGKVFGVKSELVHHDHAVRRVKVFEITPVSNGRVEVARANMKFFDRGAIIEDFKKQASLRNLPAYKHLDVFGPILDEVVLECRARGIRYVSLRVIKSKLITYYKRFGFHVTFRIGPLAWMRYDIPKEGSV